MQSNKEYLYVGHYLDTHGNYILKIGTTDNLKRRRREHNNYYRRTPNHPMPHENTFEYDWYLPLSKYNTLRYEDRNKSRWQEELSADYLNNDRFIFAEKPQSVNVKIRKNYLIIL